MRMIVEKALHNPLTLFQQTPKKEFWALRGLNFEVAPGTRLGIVGRNGAGKSTLLKLISKVTLPTTGRIEINGRIGSLLEVGTGFHPDLTGRENIYLNGALLGMKKAEIKKSFEEIVEFSEVAKFIDTPVKRYSSGMYVRLAFAIAAHLRTETLIVDEVLAVGDSRFQKKCIEKMNEVGKSGRTVLFVSHNLNLVQSVCDQALLLEEGQQKAFGPVGEVLAEYQRAGAQPNTDKEGWVELMRAARPGKLTAHLQKARLKLPNRKAQASIGDEIFIDINAQVPPEKNKELAVLIRFNTELGGTLFTLSSIFQYGPMTARQGGLSASCSFGVPALREGTYTLSVELYSQDTLIDEVPTALMLEVDGKDFLGHGYFVPPAHGAMLVGSKWQI